MLLQDYTKPTMNPGTQIPLDVLLSKHSHSCIHPYPIVRSTRSTQYTQHCVVLSVAYLASYSKARQCALFQHVAV